MKKESLNKTEEILKNYKLKDLKKILSKLHPGDLNKLINDRFVYVINHIQLFDFFEGIKNQEKLKELQEQYARKYGNLFTSDPDEQKLFGEVYKIEKALPPTHKFMPYETFKNKNDELNLVDDSFIIKKGFTKSNFYGRYRQYRLREKRKGIKNKK